MRSSTYSALDKLLHHLALGSTAIAETAFDVDQSISRYPLEEAVRGEHVFVTGLARAGTTILMLTLYDSDEFRSLTYRDMPFVLAPNLWRKLARKSSPRREAEERAHGDRIKVSIDSPESLDEAFWRLFDGKSFIKEDRLVPHRPESALVTRFQKYVAGVLNSSRPGRSRYLAKNNNNVLRLPTLAGAFPNALFLIPFRDPVGQANSLLRQDQRFVALQDADPFILTYMNWLAHHEFGKGHRPFAFGDDAQNPHQRTSLDYWLFLWCATYEWLLTTAPDRSVFVCYEDLCANPEVWHALARRCRVEIDPGQAHPFMATASESASAVDADLLEKAVALYDRLRRKSQHALGVQD